MVHHLVVDFVGQSWIILGTEKKKSFKNPTQEIFFSLKELTMFGKYKNLENIVNVKQKKIRNILCKTGYVPRALYCCFTYKINCSGMAKYLTQINSTSSDS